ncbi:branched-chain amino acid ABC transporter permease [Parapusillimonas granuli]|uniref:Branched-chain amino acid ABC transporter permease n=1 Tax=Parapusillimonas granuli TaxID=380911 RepID=A0A853G4V2_9BURK|nr:branched-chain amino acid ABC transporter permease [Parapusillimonas granuli]MBB5215309.1 branched-chain amino acid transport system permease protein [Parapusillimonas granuli]NYT50020.1 branched-chain amino acid ABC transporter permease [Parapusillimonas granuli]
MSKSIHLPGFLGLILLLVVAPFGGDYLLGIVSEILIFAIFAMSLNLLVGYTGLLSFGHSAFFGVATYVAIGLGVHLGISGWLGAVAGVIASTALAAFIGLFCIRVKGIPFLMLTMAFSQLLFATALKWRSVTGGTDGLIGFMPPDLFGWNMGSDAIARYIVIVIGFLSVLVFLWYLVRSPLGSIFIGIRDNEQRMRAIGYPVQRFKLIAFTISGCLAGIGGSLYALFNSYVSSDILHWHLSGDAMIMVILGGSGTVFGPALGAALFLLLKNYISSYNEYWAFWVGVTFIFCVMFLREGVWGLIMKNFSKQFFRKRESRKPVVAPVTTGEQL